MTIIRNARCPDDPKGGLDGDVDWSAAFYTARITVLKRGSQKRLAELEVVDRLDYIYYLRDEQSTDSSVADDAIRPNYMYMESKRGLNKLSLP